MSKIDRPGNWCKIWPKNCCEVWRKCCRNRPRKGRPENGQKSAEKGSEIGREKFGRKRLAAKLLQIRPGHSCDQFLPAMNSQSSINWVQLRNLNLWFVKTSTEASTFWWEASVDQDHVVLVRCSDVDGVLFKFVKLQPLVGMLRQSIGTTLCTP